MIVITPDDQPLGTNREKPDWLLTPVVSFYRMPTHGGRHDMHVHDLNQLYLITRGKARLANAGAETYVQPGDIVYIKAGDDHDILEIYGDEDFEKFWLYEPAASIEQPRYGHLHPVGETREEHPVCCSPVPADFPRAPSGRVNRDVKPEWVQTPMVRFSRCGRDGALHDFEHPRRNQLHLIGRGKGKIVGSYGEERYVQSGDIVCVRAGEGSRVLETYGDDPFDTFSVYEALYVGEVSSYDESPKGAGDWAPQSRRVPNRVTPRDFPERASLPQRICAPPI